MPARPREPRARHGSTGHRYRAPRWPLPGWSLPYQLSTPATPEQAELKRAWDAYVDAVDRGEDPAAPRPLAAGDLRLGE